MPTFEDAFQDYMSANPNRSESTNQLYNYEAKRYLGIGCPARWTPSRAGTSSLASTRSPLTTDGRQPTVRFPF